MNPPLPSSELSSGPRRGRILLVDDHELGRRSLCRLLEATGYEVTSVKDGKEALETLRSSTTPDFVLTDVRLPDLDGREIVQAAVQLVPRPWVALITGWDLGVEESRQVGTDWVFLKPLNISEIVAKLEEASATDELIGQTVGNLAEEGRSSP